jgi:Rrf2 family protein
MFSQSVIYAFRALNYMADTRDQEWVLAREIAEALNLPANFLAKILGVLTSEGILLSQRGKRGGFRLARPPEGITLLDICAPFDDPEEKARRCFLKDALCDEKNTCAIHKAWRKVMDRHIAFLRNTTLRDTMTKRREGGKT